MDYVIITGAGRGLGVHIAQALAPMFNIVLIGRDESSLKTTAHSISLTFNNQVHTYPMDISKSENFPAFKEWLSDQHVRPIGYVGCAGIGKHATTHELSAELWANTINTNLSANFYFSQLLLPNMLKVGSGRLVFINSVAGIKAEPYEAAYSASKHGLTGLVSSLHQEYGKHGIEFYNICSNFIDGDMTERTIHGVMERKNISYDDARQIVAKKNPQRRILDPKEVARVVELCINGDLRALAGSPMLMGY